MRCWRVCREGFVAIDEGECANDDERCSAQTCEEHHGEFEDDEGYHSACDDAGQRARPDKFLGKITGVPYSRGKYAPRHCTENSNRPSHKWDGQDDQKDAADDCAGEGFLELSANPQAGIETEDAETDDSECLVDSPAVHQDDNAECYTDYGLEPGEDGCLLPDKIEGTEDIFSAVLGVDVIKIV